MTKQDFSHFKYYAKRLKEMGFRDAWANNVDEDPYVCLQKCIGEREYYVVLADYSGYDKHRFPCIKLVSCSRDYIQSFAVLYKIGFDADFKEKIQTFCIKRCIIVDEYPTWRSAFNQLVKDFHELEKNAHKRIHKGVSIHET